MVVARSKLSVREDVVVIRVVENLFGNDFLKQFATALKEADGVVGFGETVVGFGQLRDDNNKGIGPRVMAEGNGSVEYVKEMIRLIGLRLEHPFDKLI